MYSKCCERYMLIADFNAEPCFSQFLFEMNAKNIVKEPTCIKVLLTQVVLICYYQQLLKFSKNTKAMSTGLSDFLKTIIAVSKQNFKRCSPKELVYRDYDNFDRLKFKRELEEKLNQQLNNYKHFEQVILEVFNTHVPIKRKLLRACYVPYMKQALRKAIMKKSEFEYSYV